MLRVPASGYCFITSDKKAGAGLYVKLITRRQTRVEATARKRCFQGTIPAPQDGKLLIVGLTKLLMAALVDWNKFKG